MYYYIFEQPSLRKELSRQAKIRAILEDLGIAGEVSTVSPARTAEELAQIGLSKGYSTIVAVGSTSHIDRVAKPLLSKPLALGLIPTDENPEILNLIGFEGKVEFKSLAEVLRFRRLEKLDLARIEPNKYFLTTAKVLLARPTPIVGQIDTFRFETRATEIYLDARLRVTISNAAEGPDFFTRAFRWLLGKPPGEPPKSLFHGKTLSLITPEPAPVLVQDEIVAKTPLTVVLKPRALQLIVARGKMSPEVTNLLV